MSLLKSFQPTYGAGQTQTGAAASASYVCDAAVKRSGGGNKTIVVTNNDTTNPVYVRIGQGTQVASIADYEVLAGSKESLSKSEMDDQIAIIAPAGSPSVHFIVGEGF